MENDKNFFETTDTNIAATLVTLGWPVEITGHSRQGIFIFKNKEEMEKLVADYWAHKLSVSPLKLLTTWKELKNRVASMRGGYFG
ncbi:MAG: hypothetical protein HY764_01885 [Candidatus Portnoybacteria bacterium]|nr:hypothetical protein [Candidatus Portnoybacteria bacterium]